MFIRLSAFFAAAMFQPRKRASLEPVSNLSVLHRNKSTRSANGNGVTEIAETSLQDVMTLLFDGVTTLVLVPESTATGLRRRAAPRAADG